MNQCNKCNLTLSTTTGIFETSLNLENAHWHSRVSLERKIIPRYKLDIFPSFCHDFVISKHSETVVHRIENSETAIIYIQVFLRHHDIRAETSHKLVHCLSELFVWICVVGNTVEVFRVINGLKSNFEMLSESKNDLPALVWWLARRFCAQSQQTPEDSPVQLYDEWWRKNPFENVCSFWTSRAFHCHCMCMMVPTFLQILRWLYVPKMNNLRVRVTNQEQKMRMS